MPEQFPDDAQLDEFLTFANRLADTARAVVLPLFRQNISIEIKADQSPVTVADREAESALRKLIAQTYPTHAVSGEEQGYADGDASYTWIIDPIDGTESFVCGVPTFGVLVGLLFRGIPILGVVDQPALGERWTAVAGRETLLNGQPCRSSGCTQLDQSSVFCTTPQMFEGVEQLLHMRVTEQARSHRYGLDCYAYVLLASGHIDIVMEADMQPHDYLPLVPIVEGAGGRISDWEGRSLNVASGPKVLAAANRELHEQLVALIAQPL